MKRLAALLAGACSLLCAAQLGAAPGHSYGFGSRATALGGAVAADDGNASSLFYNPALLALAPHSQLLFGYRGVDSSLKMSEAFGTSPPFEDAAIPGFSTIDAAALGRGTLLGVPIGFGLGLALTNGHLSRVRTLREDEPHWVLRETLPELFDLSAALALRPLRWLALGAGSGFLATTRGGFVVEGTALLSDGMGAEYDSQLRHSVDAELISVRYLLLGAELEVPRAAAPFGDSVDWRLGLSFRDEAKLEQALRGTLQGTVDAGLFQVPVQYSFDSHGLVAFQPRQLVLGIGARKGAWQVGVDVGWEQWSRYPSPLARSGTHIEAEVPPGLPLALPENQELPPSQSAGFEDRFTARAGVERRLSLSTRTALALRAGYAYLPTPAPRVSDVGQMLDAHEHVLSIGSGITLRELSRYLPQSLELDVHGLWGHLPNRRQERSGVTFLAKGHTLSAGLTLTLSFSR